MLKLLSHVLTSGHAKGHLPIGKSFRFIKGKSNVQPINFDFLFIPLMSYFKKLRKVVIMFIIILSR